MTDLKNVHMESQLRRVVLGYDGGGRLCLLGGKGSGAVS